MFVKLKSEVPAKYEAELRGALRELSSNGCYKVVKQEIDLGSNGETFLYLMGGMTPHSDYLFNQVTPEK